MIIFCGWSGRLAQSTTGHSFGTDIINVQKHAQDTSVLSFLLHWLTVSRVRAANIVRRLCSDSSHATAPYKLSFYYYYYYYYSNQLMIPNRESFETHAHALGVVTFILTRLSKDRLRFGWRKMRQRRRLSLRLTNNTPKAPSDWLLWQRSHMQPHKTQNPSKKQTDKQTKRQRDKETKRHVRFPFVHCVCHGRPSYGRSAILHRNLRGGDKNPGSTNKYTKFGQLTIRKIVKIIAIRCHFLRLKCNKFDPWHLVRLCLCPLVCLSVCLFVSYMEFDSNCTWKSKTHKTWKWYTDDVGRPSVKNSAKVLKYSDSTKRRPIA